MNAHVIRIQGSAWRPRKGGSVKLVIEVRPETQAEWVDALEIFKQRPELSVTVLAPVAEKSLRDDLYDRYVGHAGPHNLTAPKQGYDAIGPKADVDCPEPECALGLGHEGPHDFETPPVSAVAIVVRKDCPKPDCNLLAGHKGRCVKKKVAK